MSGVPDPARALSYIGQDYSRPGFQFFLNADSALGQAGPSVVSYPLEALVSCLHLLTLVGVLSIRRIDLARHVSTRLVFF